MADPGMSPSEAFDPEGQAGQGVHQDPHHVHNPLHYLPVLDTKLSS